VLGDSPRQSLFGMTIGLIFFIVSAASALATLTAFAALLHGRPLHTLPWAARAMLVLMLLGVSILSGIAWYETTPRTSGEVAVQQRPASSVLKEPATSTAADGVHTTSPLTIVGPQSRPRNASTTARHDEISVGEQGKALPDVVAAADDALNILRTQFHTVRGHLRSTQGQPDEGLRGLITTDLTLDVTLVDTQGVVQDTFTISSRGGGFTRDSSALQARERLRDALHEHLQKEHP
jgi:hypothetical protein